MILAISYRKSDELNNTAPGLWKEFPNKEAAEKFLKQRTSKSKTSPQGTIIFENRKQLQTILDFGFEDQPVSLQKAIQNYLKWKKL